MEQWHLTMGHATLVTVMPEDAYFWRMPPESRCPTNVRPRALQYLEPTVELGGAFKDYGHGAHLAVTPSHAGTQGMHWSLLHELGLPTRVGRMKAAGGMGSP